MKNSQTQWFALKLLHRRPGKQRLVAGRMPLIWQLSSYSFSLGAAAVSPRATSSVSGDLYCFHSSEDSSLFLF